MAGDINGLLFDGLRWLLYTYSGRRDDQSVFNQGTTLLNADFPNFGLGNSYGCSDVEQGCSVGYTDIYSESLNGMFIEISWNLQWGLLDRV
ncbi:MAG: hypothetical protein IPL69_19610 [Saprospiraceae bacterium]|nr:hypothetical protein [Candidatus Brachybacter algidus]